jgi:hypothetical protein
MRLVGTSISANWTQSLDAARSFVGKCDVWDSHWDQVPDGDFLEAGSEPKFHPDWSPPGDTKVISVAALSSKADVCPATKIPSEHQDTLHL